MYKKAILSLLLTGLWVVSCCGQAPQSEKNLVPVAPSYAQAAYNPQSDQDPVNAEGQRVPTPREQMYVFWVLGKMISYPVDKAEELIRKQISSLKSPFHPQPVSDQPSSKVGNPFTGVNWREIPPAPPVVSARPATGK
jgi:hypothetical protein